ncbi:bifunctional diaminohydroxyphosphoribosylaminopyrimidine deaminase/5-amino-6-(5-phosphoribosylamino)uracil reductase RibD [Pseudomonas kielensis]|jgi:diaminohydroxyphosphoribosylaminopyrimidine deaminase/5-amino-6-(5-phosphoribosylamino)uracil reductase|uniref:bifunctional diaminohydroxyphosphoribosylaminopyrimidine deaminase/5-amino-6-(5-phosphoribosylamino)uracil reductase RibD n=1 Tax=Pseudomonas TaxID=286 RepID=UPI0014132A89|nr:MULTISPECIES: bifunctional diaminohydroxyphosphoribosylaminopyrimidine deaminase/5-amino-6-(5-phosphoribosylamino)uracil reductase RibD [Pseudomonas]NBB34329.1 bifunctional diaminohydroxyphosphoribosylaminopyrimidine deaminase/5-amino-6-(5-phosphoribosylamino)uracil reductase RibD [Pseudomonas sp. BC115LW]UZM12461.1 bifunctional diaminohydroxyphosphoribosylaminopyrimidine deaminase/5-amino-6-(5-phosphoribosylamino)uracil reductase RibD [Pseudomonas kielensis]WKL55504.1 bifunctional diaminohyd
MTMSTEQAILDAHYMARALELARKGHYSTHPNPRVGCVIVRDGQVVGEGWHVRTGEPHAEVHALRAAGEQARGATAYVTLEPCSHHGRTPPCADGLVTAGVARVVAAMQDPNPEVAGRGLQRLEQAGIATTCGVLEGEARQLNQGFLKRMEHGLPFVRVKLAMSLDGRTAMASGESQWITGPAARSAVQRLRAQASVVLTGADTVLADDARLTVRADELGLDAEQSALAMSRPPLRVLIDGRLRVPLDAPFFKAGPALVATCVAVEEQYANGPECLIVPGEEGQVDLRKLLLELAARGVNEVLVEAGPRLAGAFAQQGLVDEYQIFVAGKFLGSTARPLLDWPLAQMKDAPALKITDIRAVGDDWRVTAIPVPAASV